MSNNLVTILERAISALREEEKERPICRDREAAAERMIRETEEYLLDSGIFDATVDGDGENMEKGGTCYVGID